MTRRNKALITALWLLFAGGVSLRAQRGIPHEVERPVERLSEKESAAKAAEEAKRSREEQFKKYEEEQREFFERYATTDREYFGWFSSGEVKPSFNKLVDDAIVSVRPKMKGGGISAARQNFIDRDKASSEFKKLDDKGVVDALQKQNQTLAPSERLKLELHENWLLPNTLGLAKADGSASATVRVKRLQDYISEAIGNISYPPPAPPK